MCVSQVVSCLKCCVLVVDWINVSYCVEIGSNNRVKFCSKSLRGRPTLGGSVECDSVCVPGCFSFPFPSPKEPKGFPRVWMVFPAVILSTATTRQSTSAMAAAYQRLLVMLMVVMVTTGAGGQDTGSSSVVRILAVFRSIRNGNDGTGHAQDPHCTQHWENGLDGQQQVWTMESLSCVALIFVSYIPILYRADLADTSADVSRKSSVVWNGFNPSTPWTCCLDSFVFVMASYYATIKWIGAADPLEMTPLTVCSLTSILIG